MNSIPFPSDHPLANPTLRKKFEEAYNKFMKRYETWDNFFYDSMEQDAYEDVFNELHIQKKLEKWAEKNDDGYPDQYTIMLMSSLERVKWGKSVEDEA